VRKNCEGREADDRSLSRRIAQANIYQSGEYLQKNPLWHIDESPWKAEQILRMLKRHSIQINSICDVGCGAGEVLRQLQLRLDKSCTFCGYEISSQAFELCKPRANETLQFKLIDIRRDQRARFDLMLVLDVLEHVENYFSLLRGIRHKARFTLFHIPLDLSVQTVFRRRGLLKRREMYAHLHYFTKDIALELLRETGYEIVDYFFTPRSVELGSGLIQAILRFPRRLCFAISEDLAVRVLGGYSLLILAR
jgi:SAM-dependent methyltransferase